MIAAHAAETAAHEAHTAAYEQALAAERREKDAAKALLEAHRN